MQIFISITMGLTIAILALWLIRREVMKASFFKHVNVPKDSSIPVGLVEQLQTLEKTVDDMNQSFYDIVSDLEGKYSVHDKEMELLEAKLDSVSQAQKELSLLLNVQGKEIASIIPEKEVDVPIKPLLSQRVKNEPLKDEIIRMKALGMDDYQIAKSLNKGVREIKMLVDLIKNE